MTENITVDKAISKGHKMLTYPCMLIMFGLIGLTFLLGIQQSTTVWIWPVGISLSFVCSWLFWSYMVVKWKVWAFENVRNVQELKKRAIQEKLIWPDYSFFNKTEIWNREDRLEWESLKKKFLIKDEFIFEDDLNVPAETIVYYSKGKNMIDMGVMLFVFAVGLYMILENESYIFGTFLCILGAFFLYDKFKTVTDDSPQIILNDKGIQTVNTKFYKWDDIESESVDAEYAGKSTSHYLTYEYENGIENLLIDDYDIDPKALKKLLRVYRSRSLSK